MPLRGESVGTAYVRILADGSDLDESIREEFRGHEPTIEAEGRKSAEAYQEGFRDKMADAPSQRKMEKSIQEGLGIDDAIKNFLNSPKWKQTRTLLEKRFGEAGALAGRNMEKELIQSADFSKLTENLKNTSREVGQAVEQITAAEGAKIKAQVRRIKTEITTIRGLQRGVSADIAEFDRIDRERLEMLGDQFETLADRVGHYKRGVDQTTKSRRALLRDLETMSKDMGKAGGDTERFKLHLDDLERTIRRSNPRLDRFSGGFDRLGDSVARSFGKGSRNDFINFFGSFVGAIASLPGLLTRTVSGVINFGRKVSDSFTEAGGGIKGLVSAFGTLVAPIALAAAALVGFSLLLGPIASLVSLLTGAIIALAASLAFALIGALGAVAGALVPVVAGIGVMVAAIVAAPKKFKNAFKPLIDDIKELGKVASGPILAGLQDAVKGLAPVIESLKPLVKGIADAIGEVIRGFGDAVKDKNFQLFITAMTVHLPEQIKLLGDIFTNTFGILGGLIRALQPLTDRFLTWLEDVTGTFSDWINSFKGQTAVKKFFNDAGDSAAIVGGFIVQIIGLVGDLIQAAAPTGDSLFQSLADSTQTLRDNIAAAIEDGSFQQWLADAAGFARDLGDSFDKIVDLINDLDTEESRKELKDLLDIINGIVDALAFAAALGDAMLKLLTGSDVQQATSNLQQMKDVLSKISGWFKDLKGDSKSLTGQINTDFSGLLSKIGGIGKSLANKVADSFNAMKESASLRIGQMKKGITDFVDDVKALPGKIKNQVDEFANAGAALANAILTGIRTGMSGAAGVVGDIASAAWDAIRGRINAAIDAMNAAIPNSIGSGPLSIDIPDNPIGHLARGGLIRSPMVALVGEAGREAVVPLDRPLSQVDPSVRELAAIARGMRPAGGRSVDASGWTIVSPGDPATVAREILDRIAAASYI